MMYVEGIATGSPVSATAALLYESYLLTVLNVAHRKILEKLKYYN